MLMETVTFVLLENINDFENPNFKPQVTNSRSVTSVSMNSRILRLDWCQLRRVVLDDRRLYRYLISCICSEHQEALQDGGQLRLLFAIMQRVCVTFRAVRGHREDRGIGDARLDVAEVRVAGESDATATMMWSWTWSLGCAAGLLHTTAAHKPPPRSSNIHMTSARSLEYD